MDPIQIVALVAFSLMVLGFSWIWIKEATALREYRRKH